MKVEILCPKGFCQGVKSAFNTALKARNENPNKQVYVLGLLVHNDLILDFLSKNNILTVHSVEEIPNGEVIVFPAHGYTQQEFRAAVNKELIIYDATCSKVKTCFKRIKTELENGREIIYVGLKGHKECESALSLSNEIHLYDINSTFDYLIKDKTPVVINQTSLNVSLLNKIHADIKTKIPNAIFVDEICDVTKLRQNTVLRLEKDVDCVIVLGDQKSSNTSRLYELCNEFHQDKECLMTNSAENLDLNSLKNKNHIVLASGTSTPDELIDEIYNLLINL